LNLNAQHLTKEETNTYIKTMPSFSIHKNNYFISGVPTNKNVNAQTADAKYQISFKQLITRSTLPWDTYLFATYSQKAFWDIYAESSPFKEINYNPSLGLGKPIFDRNNRLTGLASLMFNHHSNGRDSIFSRSWNSINLKYSTTLDEKTLLTVEAWAPFQYQEGNPDIFDYEGIAKVILERELIPEKLSVELMLQKGLTWEWKGKVRTRILYSPLKNTNQYLMLEWFAGHSESLIDYDQFRSMVRIGYVIKTSELDFLRAKSGD
jgi:phospholipase A1